MLTRVSLPEVTVIGLEGEVKAGENVVARLWDEANARFAEVAPLAEVDRQGRPVGVWGAMSDKSRAFKPWENNFTEGLYLAGVACRDGAEPPAGWTKWVLPASEYAVFPNTGDGAFQRGLAQLRAEGLSLIGAAQDFTDPAAGQTYIYYPVRRL